MADINSSVCQMTYSLYNTTSAVYTRLLVNRDMVKHYEALGLLITTVYVFVLPTHVTALLIKHWATCNPLLMKSSTFH